MFVEVFLGVILLAITVCLLIYLYFQYVYTYWNRKCVPCMPTVFPFGSAKDLVQEKEGFGVFGARVYKELQKKSDSIGGFFVFNGPSFMALDPEIVKCVLSKDFNTFHDRGLYQDEDIDPLSAHLVNLSGQKWKKLRNKVSPTFTSGKIKMMLQLLINCGNEMVKVLEKYSQTGEPLDIHDMTSRLTTDNIGSCAFGIDCNSVKNPDAEFRKYGKMIIDTTFGDSAWQVIGAKFPWFMKLFRIPITNRKVSKFMFEVLRETIDAREKSKIDRNDFLDLFIKLKNNQSIEDDGSKAEEALTFNELAAQAFIFFVGGFETSGTTLTFLMYELSINQPVQDKLREETFKILQKHGNEITYEALMEMPFLEKVISEGLRKYPPLPFLNRKARQDFPVPGTDITVNKGVMAWISVMGLHHDPKYYPEPEKFDPERFSEEEKAKRHPFTYLPFGEGPRICIGMRFGMLQMKVAIVNLIKNYKFTLNDKTKLPLALKTKGLTLGPRTPIYLNCTKVTE